MANRSYDHSCSRSGQPVMTAVLSVFKQAWQRPRYVAASTADPQLHPGIWPGSASAIARVLHEHLVYIIAGRVAEKSPAEQPQ
jgi:hypothetical protein